MANKIKYGLKNVYYAIATIASDGSATYSTPVAFPGAVSLSLEPQGENTPFYADNITYWVGAGNNGYQGDLEMAMIIDAFKTDVLGYLTDVKDVFYEDKGAQAIHFALLFQFEGDDKATRHVMYNCTATSIYNDDVKKDIVKAEAGPTADETTYNGWFGAVYQPTV